MPAVRRTKFMDGSLRRQNNYTMPELNPQELPRRRSTQEGKSEEAFQRLCGNRAVEVNMR